MSDAEENGLIAKMIGPKKRWRADTLRARKRLVRDVERVAGDRTGEDKGTV